MSLRERIEQDLKTALLQQKAEEVSVLRMLVAALHNEAIAKRKKDTGLSEEEEVAVLRRECKKREEAAAEYARVGRVDLQGKEEAEARIARRYLPAELSDEEIMNLVRQAVTGGVTNIGEVMKTVMPRLRGQTPGERVRKIAEELLPKQ